MANKSFTDFLRNVTKRLINTTSTYFAELQAVILYNSSEAELLTAENPGNVAITGTVPVDGPLTDAEMRDSPVDVDVDAIALPTTLLHGVVTVTTATTRVALAASTPLVSGVFVKAAAANTGIVYVGGATVAAANGFRLAAGESVFVEIANLATVYVDASVNAQIVTYIAS